jgi:hypothetical protein
VGGIERVGDLNSPFHDLIDRQGTTGEAVSERGSLEQLHDDEVMAFVLADVMNGADVRVIEGRGRARLALEPLLQRPDPLKAGF